jgi:hypothetical protein
MLTNADGLQKFLPADAWCGAENGPAADAC